MLEEQPHHLEKSCKQKSVSTASRWIVLCLNMLQGWLYIVDMDKLILVMKINWDLTENRYRDSLTISVYRDSKMRSS